MDWRALLVAIAGGLVNAIVDDLLIAKDFSWRTREGIGNTVEVFVIGALIAFGVYMWLKVKPSSK